MARRRKSSKTDKEEVRLTAEGLRHPYPAKPGDGKYVLYCDAKKENDDCHRVYIPIFTELYAAHRIVSILIGKDTWEECEPIGTRTGIITSGGVRITTFHNRLLDEILPYKPTELEAEWRDERQEQAAMRFRFGTWEKPKALEVEEEVVDEDTGEVTVRKVKAPKEKKEKKEKKAKLDKTGMVTASDLAERLKIEPRIFRGALRALKKVKPVGGWLWTKDEAEEIFKEISSYLKKDEKKKKKK